MATGSHLKVKRMGQNAHGVVLTGNKNTPEHEMFVVFFPGGSVEISRTSDGDYWAHVGVNHRDHVSFNPEKQAGKLVDGRMDVIDKHASEVDGGDIDNPLLDHIAIRIAVS